MDICNRQKENRSHGLIITVSLFIFVCIPFRPLRQPTCRLSINRRPFTANLNLVAVHGDSLRVSAELAISRWADGSATTSVSTAGSAALLQGHELFGAESLVVDLAGGFDEVLKVGAGQEVAEVHEFAVVLVFDVDDTPAVLAAAYLLSVDDNVLLASDDGEGDNILDSLAP